MSKELIVNALITAINDDLKSGKNKNEIMNSLKSLIHEEIYNKVKTRI